MTNILDTIDNGYPTFDKIFVEKNALESPHTKRILKRLNKKPDMIVDKSIELIRELPPVYHPADRSRSLFIGELKGEIVQKCPGSHGHICCNYSVINLYLGCPINCTYCILQAYLNQPFTIINTNIDYIFNCLDSFIEANKGNSIRIGTGELGDSLVYDHLTDYSLLFVDYFNSKQNAVFEFKTKTNNINNLLKIKSNGNIVVGFSVNPQSIIDKEEKYAVSLKDRIDSMEKLINNNYSIALHFDPMFNIDNFKDAYKTVIDAIFSRISPKNISWISLGTFRYNPELKNSIQYNYPETDITNDEFIKCYDNKFRYFKPIRSKIYKFVYDYLKSYSKNLKIYLCMESADVWKKTADSKEFDRYLFS